MSNDEERLDDNTVDDNDIANEENNLRKSSRLKPRLDYSKLNISG